MRASVEICTYMFAKTNIHSRRNQKIGLTKWVSVSVSAEGRFDCTKRTFTVLEAPLDLKMGKAKSWNVAEITATAQSWIEASEDGTEVSGGLSGSEQTQDQFWAKVMENIEKRAPADAMREARFHHRGVKTIKNYWRDNIAKECNAFNRSLLIVYNSNPTGCNENDKVNMAAAIHQGKVERMEYRFKDYDARNWKFFGAWKVLRGHRKFLPPQQPVQQEPEETEVAAAAEGATCTDDSGEDSPADSPEARALFNTPTANIAPVDVAKRSRGNGPGRNATKQLAALEEHRSKKLKAIEDLTAALKEKNQTNKILVDNQATYQAFMMAKAGLQASRDDPYWSVFYKKKMLDCIGGLDSDDEEQIGTEDQEANVED